MEFMLLLGFSENSLGGSAEDALASFAKLTMEFPSLIVQATQGVLKGKRIFDFYLAVPKSQGYV